MIYNNVLLQENILYNILEQEICNSRKLYESLNIAHENGIVLEMKRKSDMLIYKIKAKISELWTKFIDWFDRFIKRIKEFFNEAKLKFKKENNKKKCDDIKESIDSLKASNDKLDKAAQEMEGYIKDTLNGWTDTFEELQKVKDEAQENINRRHEALHDALNSFKQKAENIKSKYQDDFDQMNKALNDLGESASILHETDLQIIDYGPMVTSKDYKGFINLDYTLNIPAEATANYLRLVKELISYDIGNEDPNKLITTMNNIFNIDPYIPSIKTNIKEIATRNALNDQYIDSVQKRYDITVDNLNNCTKMLDTLNNRIKDLHAANARNINSSSGDEDPDNGKVFGPATLYFAATFNTISCLTALIKPYEDIQKTLSKYVGILDTNLSIINRFTRTITV